MKPEELCELYERVRRGDGDIEELYSAISNEGWRLAIEDVRRERPNMLEPHLRKKLGNALAEQMMIIIRRSKRAARGNPRAPRARFVTKRQQQRRRRENDADRRLLAVLTLIEQGRRNLFAGCPRYYRYQYGMTPEHFGAPGDINCMN
jgi:hypothetical protein